MTYNPRPVDTSDIEPDQSLYDLIEKLAENVHEVWARQRMDQGWTYGPERNDIDKKHPCMVEYGKLSAAISEIMSRLEG